LVAPKQLIWRVVDVVGHSLPRSGARSARERTIGTKLFRPQRHIGGESRALVAACVCLLCPALATASAPVVDSLETEPASVMPGGTTLLTVMAHDPDCPDVCTSGCGQRLRADLTVWTADGGTFLSQDNGTSASPYTATATWQAPAIEGTYTITVQLSDSGTFMCGGRSTIATSVSIQVTTTPNEVPVIESLTADPAQLFPGASSQLACSASDADGDPITYGWGADGGSVVPTGSGTAAFDASLPGVFTVTCTASDPSGGEASESIQLSYTDAVADFAIVANLATPSRLDVDSYGYVYVADPGEGGITVLSLANGELVYRLPVPGVRSVAVDWNDRLLLGGNGVAWVADRSGKPLVRLHPGAALGRVADVAVDMAHGRYVVLYGGPGRVVVFNAGGAVIGSFGSTGDAPEQLKAPQGVAVTPGGEIVVADGGHGQIKIFEIDGTLQASFGGLGGGAGKFVRLDDVAVDASGVIFASDSFQSWVQSFNPDGSMRETLGTFGPGVGQFMTPAGISAVGNSKRIVVASLNSSSLQVFRTSDDPVFFPSPQATLSPVELAFEPQLVGSESGPQLVTLENLGEAPLGVRSVTTNGDFSQTHDCGLVVDRGGTCSFEVVFSPERAGPASGSLRIDTNATPNLQALTLHGNAFLAGDLVVSPNRLSFGDQDIGTVSESKAVTLTNPGTQPLAINAITVSAEFGVLDTCGGVLAAGASCDVEVNFAPTANGDAITGALTIDSSAASGRATVLLEAAAISRQIIVTPKQVDFGQLSGRRLSPRSRASKTKGHGKKLAGVETVTVLSVGSQSVAIGTPTLEGVQAGAFDLSADVCTGAFLFVDEICTFDVVFDPPPEPGLYSAAVRLPSSDPNSPDFVTLSGRVGSSSEDALVFEDDFESGDMSLWSTVFPSHPPLLELLPEPPTWVEFELPPQRVGDEARQILTVLNRTRRPTLVGLVSVGGESPFAYRLERDTCAGSWLRPGAACTVTLVFAPIETGAQTAEIVVSTEIGVAGILTITGIGRLEGNQ